MSKLRIKNPPVELFEQDHIRGTFRQAQGERVLAFSLAASAEALCVGLNTYEMVGANGFYFEISRNR